jgi:hypothetical protein
MTSPRKRLLLLVCSTIVALLGAELVVRWLEAGRHRIGYVTAYDPALGWSKETNRRVENRTAEYHVIEETNSRGLRGPELTYEKAPGVYRVLLLGDSFLEGYTVNFDDLVSERVRKQLEKRLDRPVEVVNGGTVGYSTDQELLFYEREGRRYQPDATVLLFYVNDVWFNQAVHYWRGSKPRFLLEGDELKLTNSPAPPPNPDEFAYAVPGGGGFARLARQTDAWFGARSAFYRLARKALVDNSWTRRWLIDSGLAAVPGEWQPWRKEQTPELREAWMLTEALLKKLRGAVEADGSTFAIFYVPSRAAVYPATWEEQKFAYAMTDEAWDPVQDAKTLDELCRSNAFT